jgi:hypothetical protein
MLLRLARCAFLNQLHGLPKHGCADSYNVVARLALPDSNQKTPMVW